MFRAHNAVRTGACPVKPGARFEIRDSRFGSEVHWMDGWLASVVGRCQGLGRCSGKLGKTDQEAGRRFISRRRRRRRDVGFWGLMRRLLIEFGQKAERTQSKKRILEWRWRAGRVQGWSCMSSWAMSLAQTGVWWGHSRFQTCYVSGPRG